MKENSLNSSIYLIPVPIVEDVFNSLSKDVEQYVMQINHYFVENLKTARHFLKKIRPAINFESICFSEIDKHSGSDYVLFKNWINEGHKIGIMSESGCPGVADPGTDLILIAQQLNIRVIPLTGPNSILLALMASGLNGQNFCFRGYLPIKEPLRSKSIKNFESFSIKENQTQIFIETPYRNNALLTDLIKICQSKTKLCIAQNITSLDEYIKTKTIENWRKEIPKLTKTPIVFLINGF